MKYFRLYFSLLLVITLLNFSNCKKNNTPQPADYMLSRGLSVYFKDSLTNHYLIGKNGEPYNPDSIKIYKKENGVQDIIGSAVIDSLGHYACNFLYFFTIATKEEDFEVVSIELPVFIYFNQSKTDTIKIKKQPFTPVNIFWNEKLITSIPALSNQISILTIKK